MACIISRPDPETLFRRHRDMFSVNVLGGSPIVPESNEWYVASLNYAVAEEFYSLAEQQWRERDPRYACCDNLIDLARVDGVFPKGASFAGGFVRVTGTAGARLVSGLQFLIDGKNYIAAGPVPAYMPQSGEFYVRIQAVEPGEGGNSDPANPATTGTLITTIAGVDRDVAVAGGSLCGGAPAEDCEAFRQRYLSRKQFAPRADAAWIKEKLLEWPCATRVCKREGTCCISADLPCDNCQDCARQLNFYVMFDNTFPCGIAPACVVDELTVWMFGANQGYGEGQAPVGVCGRIYPVTGSNVSVVISGAGCYSAAQRGVISDRVTAYFKTVCPSSLVEAKSISAIVAQVLGTVSGIEVAIHPEDTSKITTTPCGDIEANCDVMPCLTGVSFTDEGLGLGGCVG